MTRDLWPEGQDFRVWAALDGVFEEAGEDDGLVRFVLAEPGTPVDGRLRLTLNLGERPLKTPEGTDA